MRHQMSPSVKGSDLRRSDTSRRMPDARQGLDAGDVYASIAAGSAWLERR